MTTTRNLCICAFALGGALGCTIGGSAPDPGEQNGFGIPPAGDLPPTRETAEAILTRVADLYQDHAAAAPRQGTHTLAWRLDTNDSVPHAFAQNGREWHIVATAALITAPNMTADLFALLVCHEAGHLVGGFPFKSGRSINIDVAGTAIAAESQSDYFAAKDCLPRLWASDTNANTAVLHALTAAERARCKQVGTEADQALCARILRASLQFGRYLAELHAAQNGQSPVYPALDTPDTSTLDSTKEGYPSDQCRIDTLLAGMVCSVKNTGVGIPGLLAPYGELSLASQEAAKPFACQSGAGARPRCWFQPDGKPTDCSTLGAATCVRDNGQEQVRYCSPTSGVSYYSCLLTEVCKTSAEGYADCYPPDVDPNG